MSKKCRCEEGAPMWMVTYGDMMTLLMCFFVLLFSFSEIKRDSKYMQVIDAIKQRFGYTGTPGKVPVEDPPLASMIKQMEEMVKTQKVPTHSNTDDEGVTGKNTSVKRIREGLQFTVGGWVTFDPGEVSLKERAKQEIAKIAKLTKGHNNKIDIRGHAAGVDMVSAGSADADLWDLSYRRAKSAKDFLVNEQGIREERIRVTACGDKEPLVKKVYKAQEAGGNRRVEIIVTEALVKEFQKSEK